MSTQAIHPSKLKESCLLLLRDKLLVWLNDGSAAISLAENDSMRRANLRLSKDPQPPLKAPSRSTDPMVMQHWPEAGLWSGLYPVVCCVTEGEADFVIANAKSKGSGPGRQPRYEAAVAQLPMRTFLVLAPGTAFPDGTRIHWERPDPTKAASEILWMAFLPSGVVAHLCYTRGTQHAKSWSLFVNDARLSTLAENIIDDLQSPAPITNYSKNLLTALLLRFENRLGSGHAVTGSQGLETALSMSRSSSGAPPDSANLTLSRAVRYIEEHLNEAITAEKIASHAYASQSHLNRLFREKLDKSIMEYVISQRLALACSMLQGTDLIISEIGQYVGYHEPSHFSHIFRQRFGVSPAEYRRNHRSGSTLGAKSA